MKPAPVTVLALERALELPAAHGLIAFTGPPASGKTEALVRRFAVLVTDDPALGEGAIVSAARDDAAQALARRIRAATGIPVQGATLDALAFEVLRAHPLETGLALDLELVDPLDAEEIFERAAEPLFSAEWSDWLGADIDPEIAGLRMPDRFAAAALRLIRKLRDAGIDDESFLQTALRGAATFYANPPNLASPALVAATKDEHRASLTVDASELDRQRRRELDLAKILARLYRSYVEELVRHGCLTANDALVEATRIIEQRPAIARALRTRLRVALVDDAHDLPIAALRFLRALFGDALDGVTVAGDPDAATQTFAGARPDRIFGHAATTVVLAPGPLPPQILAVRRAVIDADPAYPVPTGEAVRTLRAADRDDEAAQVAERVAALLRAGTPPARIAVLHRTLRTLTPYEDALLARDVPVALAGDPALFHRAEVRDALSLLWIAVDPFAHVWTLRALQTPMLRLSDASLAILCGEPANPQPALFPLPEGEEAGDRRWDRKRDLRLGTNVLTGERDPDLAETARERLHAFRARRARWTAWLRETDVTSAARAIVEDGGLLLPRDGETAARTRLRATLLARLLGVIGLYAARHPRADLAAALAYCERLAAAECGPELLDERDDAVVVGAIDRVLARRFDHVFVVDARAGAFPPYYVPDAFLFSTTYGMIPKDAAGDAVAARTAKFSWYEHQAKPRVAYVREQRRLFAQALGRADVSVTVSAGGRPTRGIAAPEFVTDVQSLLAPR
ncbi:MAG TPA: UvrD-helicase domain-containing protein [Candidatus Limnocylindria bacterium]|nr:UvrD-helicase domain-containing protein [Candidatus Limnocylindria bacterium]